MKIELLDYAKNRYLEEIPDDTKEIAVIYLTGDDVLVYPHECDPAYHTRSRDFFEGSDVFKVSELIHVIEDGVDFLRLPK